MSSRDMKDTTHLDIWLDAKNAAAYLALPTVKALYAAVARGEVPAHRFGKRRLRFKVVELAKIMHKQRDAAEVMAEVTSRLDAYLPGRKE